MSASYAKLQDGSWGIRASGKLVAGQTVTVTKKSGESKPETVAAIVWTGPDRDGGESTLATIKATSKTTSKTGSQPAGYGGGIVPRSGRGRASGAGHAASVPGFSSWCTDRPGCGCYDCAS